MLGATHRAPLQGLDLSFDRFALPRFCGPDEYAVALGFERPDVDGDDALGRAAPDDPAPAFSSVTLRDQAYRFQRERPLALGHPPGGRSQRMLRAFRPITPSNADGLCAVAYDHGSGH
jgi:hypothetical protein